LSSANSPTRNASTSGMSDWLVWWKEHE